MKSVRVWIKRKVELQHLNVDQKKMFHIGNVGVASVKNRLLRAQGPNDSHAKPLTKRYAILKTKSGKGNKRTLSFTGDMLRQFQVRTVNEKQARAYTLGRGSVRIARTKKGRLVGVENKIKAWVNNKIETWCVFSPRNKKEVLEAGKRVVDSLARRLAVERFLGGK